MINTNYSSKINSMDLSNYNCSDKRIGGIPLPDYDAPTFATYTPSSLSDEEWRDAIVAQAKKDQSQGKFQHEGQGWLQLYNKYVSVVSPDRKAIINAGLSAINSSLSKIKIARAPIEGIELLLQFLNYKVDYKAVRDMGTYQAESATFYDSNGKAIAYYSADTGWSWMGTDAEHARSQEFCSIYNKAWKDAANGVYNSATDERQSGFVDGNALLAIRQSAQLYAIKPSGSYGQSDSEF